MKSKFEIVFVGNQPVSEGHVFRNLNPIPETVEQNKRNSSNRESNKVFVHLRVVDANNTDLQGSDPTPHP